MAYAVESMSVEDQDAVRDDVRSTPRVLDIEGLNGRAGYRPVADVDGKASDPRVVI